MDGWTCGRADAAPAHTRLPAQDRLPRLIAKIEKPQAIDNLDAIIEVRAFESVNDGA